MESRRYDLCVYGDRMGHFIEYFGKEDDEGYRDFLLMVESADGNYRKCVFVDGRETHEWKTAVLVVTVGLEWDDLRIKYENMVWSDA